MSSPFFREAVAVFSVVLREPRPPSVNAMYSDGATQRFLTNEGKAFKDALREVVASATHKLDWKKAVDEVYRRRGYASVYITIFVERFYNDAWTPGSRTKPSATFPKGNLRSPYQKVDAGSYDKVIQDAIVLGTGIDDSLHLHYQVTKAPAEGDPRIEVEYMVHRGDRTDHT